MITFHLSMEVKEDRRVTLELPPETPVGKADLMVTIAPRVADTRQGGSLRQHFGAVRGSDARSGDNEKIDADLARAYDVSSDEIS